MSPALPPSRGPISAALLETLRRPPHDVAPPPVEASDPLGDEDLHLALYCCYELHYHGFDEVDERWEWQPSLLAFRARLEALFEVALRDSVPCPGPAEPDEMDLALRAVIDADEAPPLSRYVESQATLAEVLELLMHRSAYQLKEADPHSWVLPRLRGGPKAAMIEIQADEYGGGQAERIHAQLFADELAALGLDPAYGAYLDRLPGATLATVNLMSFFGLHRRWRGAIVGHLAAYEMNSAQPNRRYGNGLRRLGRGDATAFHDEHVVADAVHESIAAVDLVGGLASQDARLGADALWGAACLIEIDGRFARRLMDAWHRGESSLLEPLPAPAAA